MPSFDAVCEIDKHELRNAVDQSNREITGRFDFKGADARIEQTDAGLMLHAESEFQLNQMMDILNQKMSKRGIDLACLEAGEVDESNRRARQPVTIKQGVDQDSARKIVKMIKGSKLKVQAAIQGDQVRITGKKRDDLQEAIVAIKAADLGLPLQFTNFRD